MSTIYTPPPRLCFRLIGYVSQSAIFSRNSVEPNVSHLNVSHGDYPDQWFTLIHDPKHKGLYAIQSEASGKVLFSRKKTPAVGNADGGGQFDDNWFKFEPGSGQYTGYFRLVTPSQGTVLFSRLSPDPPFGNHFSSNFQPNQLFRFLWEDMQVDKIEFNLNAGQIFPSTPVTLTEQVLSNNSEVARPLSFSVDKRTTNSSTFDYGSGFTVTLGMEFGGFGIPTIVEGKFQVDKSVTDTWTWGKTASYTTRCSATFPVPLGPRKSVRATSLVNQGMLSVPYTMHLISKNYEVKVQTTGTWRGFSSWDLRHSITNLSVHGL